MRRFASLALLAASLTMAGCLQDFDQFLPGGTGGASTTTSTVTSSSSSSSSSSTGAGMCDPPDCDDSDPCTTDTCNGTTCSNVALMDGTPVPNGNIDMNDCVQPVCMGGMPTNVPLDSEIPSDGEECTTDVCSGGMIQSTPVMNGTKCGAGMAFDCIAGKCGCNMPVDCGMDGECGARTCTGAAMNKTCGWAYATGDSSMQSTGDCRKRVCNGSSEVADVVADDDPMVDANPCTQDECNGAMMTTHDPEPAGTGCGGTKECGGGNQAGTCCTPAADVCMGKECGTLMNSCNVPKTCGMCSAGTPACVANQCEECSPGGTECMTNPVGHACITGNVCGCTVPGDCGGAKPVCDTGTNSPKKNECVQCVGNGDCSGMTPVCDTNPAHTSTFGTCVACNDDAQCTTMGLTKCATVGGGIGTCVQCDLPSNNSPECAASSPPKCNNAHMCGN